MATLPLDVPGVMATCSRRRRRRCPPGTVLGHVHPNVATSPRPRRSTPGRSGSRSTTRGSGRCSAAGGYHHRPWQGGWRGPGALPTPRCRTPRVLDAAFARTLAGAGLRRQGGRGRARSSPTRPGNAPILRPRRRRAARTPDLSLGHPRANAPRRSARSSAGRFVRPDAAGVRAAVRDLAGAIPSKVSGACEPGALAMLTRDRGSSTSTAPDLFVYGGRGPGRGGGGGASSGGRPSTTVVARRPRSARRIAR